jgi:hypothetical protein
MAKRMGAKTIEVKASHLSLVSQPDEITQLILEAAGQRHEVRENTSGHVVGYQLEACTSYVRRATRMNILNIVVSPRKEKSASASIVNAFLSEYREHFATSPLTGWIFGESNFPSSTRKQSMLNTRVSPANR